MPCAPAISTMSLGRAWVHQMPEKLRQAGLAGFQGVEMFYEDLEYLAKAAYGDCSKPEHILGAARQARSLCDENGLVVMALQPFWFYEGLIDRHEHELRIQKLKLWFQIAKLLNTDLIQIPSNFLTKEHISGDLDLIVADLIEVADLGLQQNPPIRFAYESLAWSTYVDTWEQSWDIVQRVNRPNFGCCLDTFNIAGRVWADPASPTGKTPNADADLEASLDRLRRTVDARKIFFLQVVDAEEMETPLIEGHPWHNPAQPSRMSWSRNARLFAYETDRGGYLPILKVAQVIFEDLKYEGWVSMELFSRTMTDPAPTVPEDHAKRGIASWKKLKSDFLETKSSITQLAGRL
ncbi:hypothetical protein PISL3812_00970 [Talaromyces islandicus]|uniref:Xylose isomerase-like TIM barrel domain-containing protein n=1 Tax=Talaromyces islandicus TaxID=28573 RepID=A0A0U1LMG6_TALIS|nr:hypothetical protein PISL3812_00970 [Talaromyces islandicus]